MFGLTIGGKHTYNDYGLVCTKYHIPEPDVKLQRVDLPFASGSIDLTDATGETPYEDREGIEFEFVVQDHAYAGWDTAIQIIAMDIHGQKLQMISDNDTAYYYNVRLQVDYDKSYKEFGTITLTGTAEPFKYAVTASHEPWLWNPFNFKTGVIISTADINVNGTTSITIPAGGVKTSPSFIVTQTTGLGIIYNTNPPRTLPMATTGTYRFPQIKCGGSTATTLTFTGIGRVSIAYRSRYL